MADLSNENITPKAIHDKVYNKYVDKVTPKNNGMLNAVKAFVTGGVICVLGQCIIEFFKNVMGFDTDLAGTWCSIILILLSVILTGLGIYPLLTSWGGAGALVPITGFANSVVAPAIEYKAEGQVFGIGCKIFTIAGPVILYGIFSSWLLGIIYWLFVIVL